MRWILESGVNSRLLVIAIAATLMVIGLLRLGSAPVEALPDFGPVRVNVQTEALGLAPEEVENLITNPMEQEFFNGMPWLHKIRSDSLPGLSSVEMIFEPGTEPVHARQVVQERLTMTPALPQVSKPPFVIQPVATTSRALILGMSSNTVSLIDMSVLARWKIRQRLLSTPGVANVAIWGFRDRQLQVLVEPERLQRDSLELNDVVRTAGNAMWSSPLTFVEASTPGTGGFIDTANQRISVQHIQPIRTAEDLSRITVEGARNSAKLLGNVAQIVEEHQLLIGDALVRGAPGLLLVIERFPDWSYDQVTRNVEQAMDAMRPGLDGIEFDTVFRPATYTGSARTNLAASLGIGITLLVIALVAFLFSWRQTLICVATMALSVAAAWLVLSTYGVLLDAMVVAGLVMAIAVIVDDSIIEVDQLQRRLRRRREEGGDVSVLDTVVSASLGMRRPMLWALIIVLASIVPVFVAGEVSGAFLQPLATSYVVAVLASMLVALVVTPALAVTLLSDQPSVERLSPLAAGLARRYEGLLSAVVRRPVLMLVLAAIVTAGGLATVPQLRDARLVPPLVDRDLLVRLEGEPGLSLTRMRALSSKAIEELRGISGVRDVAALMGRASTSDKVVNVNSGELLVSVESNADYDATVAAVAEKMAAGYASLKPVVTTYPEQRIREVTEGTDDDLVVRVYGRDYDVLLERADTVAKSIDTVEGVVNPEVVPPPFEPTVEIEVIVSKASAKGLKPGDIRRGAAIMLSGITAGNMFEEQKIFDVVVWGTPERRRSLEDISELRISAPSGELVRLADVAEVRVRPNPSVIKHDAVSRYVDVVAEVRGRSIDETAGAVAGHLKRMSFPAEHHVEVLGDSVERERTARALVGYSVGALLTILFLLQAYLTSWRLAFLGFAMLLPPLAVAALAAGLSPGGVSVVALMGGFAVLAVAARGAMLLMGRYRELEHERRERLDAVFEGSMERFPAIILSSLGAALALLPVTLFGAAAGTEIVAPLALIVIGGLIGAALVNLLVLPALYLRVAPEVTAIDASGLEPEPSQG